MHNYYFYKKTVTMSKNKIITDARDLIRAKMKEEGRTMQWLCDKTGIPYGTLNSCIKMKSFAINEENLKKINKALEADFTVE